MWNPFAVASALAASILRTEQLVGKTADALAGMAEQLDKVEAEITAMARKSQELDQADHDAIAAVRERVQKLDDLNPDAEPPV